MESVAACIKKYFELSGRTIVYHLAGNETVQLRLPKDRLYHLLGLRYLADIRLFEAPRSKLLALKKVLRGEVTQQQIERSHFYIEFTEDRITYFDHFNRFFEEGQCDELVLFNPKAVSRTANGSQIEADYMLYLILEENHYLHLFLKVNLEDGYAYPCSYFHRAANDFLNGQRNRIPIEKIEIKCR